MPSFLSCGTASCERRISESRFRFSLSKSLFLVVSLFLLSAVVTFAQTTVSVVVSPQRGGVTVGQTLSIVVVVTNDVGSAGVSWTVSTGGTLSGQTTTTASFSAATAGVYTITATSIADVTKSASATIGVTDLAGVLTYHNNLSRDGSNPSEYALTTSNVTAATFAKLFSCTVDGAIYTQPLWVANVTISSVKHNVVLVATQHESLYAFDADASPCTTLWSVSLVDANHGGTAGETSVPSGTTGSLVGSGYGDITPEVGVTGTPVIDPSSGTLYVVSKSVIASSLTFFQRLHAIDITTGAEKSGSPVTIAGTYPGTGDGGTTTTFVARQQNQRPGLALVNGIVYIAWSSHEDTAPYYGWVLGYNTANLAQAPVILNLTPNVRYGGIWMGGAAPSADSSNNLYLITGNATFDATSTTAPKNDYGDSFLKLTGGLSVSQYFTPSDQANDNSADQDFGSGGAAILVDQPTSPVTHLVIGGGKDGYLYLLNRDAMGGLGDSNAWQRFYFGTPIFATGAFWNGQYYLAGVNGHLQGYTFNAVTGMFGLSSVPHSPGTFGFPGSTPSVSASSTTNGIVWALNNGSYCTSQSTSCGPAVLHAYDATNVATELWNSTMGTGNAAGNAVKFNVPTVANGKVYVGTRGNNIGGATSSTTIPGELDVYGLSNTSLQAATPTFSPAGGTYSTGQLVTISDGTSGATIYYTTNGTTPTTASTVYTTPVSVTVTGTTIQAFAVASGLLPSAVGSSTYLIVPLGPAPTLTSAAPNTGMQAQVNLSVILTGTNFLTSPVCNFGSGITVNSCIYNSATQITATISIAANATIGTNTISITDTDGQVATLSNGFSITINTNPFSPILVNSGGASYTDSQAQVWSADKNFTGGSPASTTHAIANTPDPKLYQTERYGNFTYQFAVPNGSYTVTLKFAEIYWTTVGQRIFNVAINGTPVLTNFDIIAAAGASNAAIDKTFPMTTSTGAITIQFTSGSADLPKISAIEISAIAGVFVQVSPTPVNLYASQQQQFTASVTGNSNTAVNWTYSPQVGTLTAGGLYTAPISVTSAQTISVTATSQADTTKSATVTVNLLPPVSFSPIFVNSGGAAYTDTLGNAWKTDTGFTGGSTASTTSSIANTPDPKLYQTERYGNSSYQFTVPNGSYNVVLKFAEFYWTKTGQRIFNVAINGTQVLTNFDIVAAAGAALTAIDKSFPVTVTGGSITIQFIMGSADLPKISAIEISAIAGVLVQVSPTPVNLYASQQQQFTASVTGSTNTAVNWTYSPQVGTLTVGGLYTAPASITAGQTVSVTATSQADTTKSATATVNLLPPASVLVQVSPTPVNLYASQQQQFTASVTGNTNTAVNWTYSPQVGALTVGGLYTAPASITAGQTVSVTATSQADTTKSATATVNLLPPVSVLVQVSPTPVNLYASQQQQFTSSVTGSTNTAVNWTYSPQVGTLTVGGLYTAPASITSGQTVSVTATSQADTTKSATATVNLLPPASFTPIFVNSGGAAYTDSLGNVWKTDTGFTGGSTASTTSNIANTPDPKLYQTERYGNSSYVFTVPAGSYTVILKFAEIYWTATGKRLFNTTINGTQVLTNFDIVAAAGAAFTAIDRSFPVTVTGNSITIQFSTGSADLPKISAIEIKAASGVGIQISPISAFLFASQSQQFGATVTGTTNLGVTWTYSPLVGTLVTSGTTAGLYTAPSSISTTQSVYVTATSVADPTQASTAAVSLIAPFSPIFVNSGGSAYTDTLGNSWSADADLTGGATASTTSNIVNTADPKLYQTERYGNSTYQFTVPNGSYSVLLKFAEIYWTMVGQRIFNVSINGTQVLTNFDIIAAAGASLTAIDKTFPVSVTNNKVTIQFTTGSADMPKISAIEIH